MTRSNPAKRATIRDVASRAGVSVATASRVLSGSDYPVSARMRAKVTRAVTELDYVANAHARALSGARTKIIAMVSSTINSPFYADIAAGVSEEAAASDRLCIYATSGGEAEAELAIVSLMRQQQADAVILMGGVIPTREYRERMARYARNLSAAGCRLILCGRPEIGESSAIMVGYDNLAGARAITGHLASYGHQRILHLAGVEGNTTATDRVSGYRQAVEQHGLENDPDLVMTGEFNRESGYRRIVRRLNRTGGQPDYTAIFAADDTVASGAMRALREAGVSLPRQVSVVGYNDSIPAEDLSPLLTTVHIPAAELGRTAVRVALAPSPPPRPVILNTHIVARESVTHPAEMP